MPLKTNYVDGDTFGASDINNTNSYILGTTYTNIAVSGTPTALGSYMPWDTQELYGYYLDVAVQGITTNSLIRNIIMTDTLLASIGYIVTTDTNKLRFYTQDDTALSGTILTLIISEVA